MVTLLVARMGSSRLPGKVVRPILGQPMLGRMIDRVKRSRWANRVIVVTTTHPEDDRLEALAHQWGAGCFRGSSEDVLGRVRAAASIAEADTIVELLGDNPLVHADLIDDVVAFFHGGVYDYGATVTSEYPHASAALRRFPLGIRVQVFSREALIQADQMAKDPFYREHPTRFIYEHPEFFRLGYFEARGRWEALHRPQMSLAVNTAEDFRLLEAIFARCAYQDPYFSIQEALRAYDSLREGSLSEVKADVH